MSELHCTGQIVVRGDSGEAVRIIEKPGQSVARRAVRSLTARQT
jgi:hypothetical protein